MVGPRRRQRRRHGLRRDRRSRTPRRRRSRRAARSRTPRCRTPIPRAAARARGSLAAVAAARAADQVVIAVGETREMSGEANARSKIDLPGRQEELIKAISATGKPVAVVLFNGRPLGLEDIVGTGAGDPRGVVPRRRGRQRGRRRRVRQGQPRRQAAGVVPVPGRAGADLLQPRSGRAPVQQERQVELAAPRHPELRPAVRLRVRAQLHDVRGLQPAAELVDGVARGQRGGDREREEHGQQEGRRGRAALHQRSGRERSRSRCGGCAGSSA